MNVLIISILSVGLIFICSVCGLTEISSGNEIGARKLLAKGRHRNNGHQSLAKKDNVEMELLKLKDPTKEDKDFITLTDQQPQLTSENLEEELTDVRPLDLLEVETLDELDDVTRSMRSFGQVDVGLTTVSVTQEMEAAFRSDTELGSWDQDVDIRTVEGDGTSRTEISKSDDILKRDKQNIERNEDDDDEDEDDDESDEDDDSDDDDDNKNDSDENEEEEDDDNDESVENTKDKNGQINNEEHINVQKKIKNNEIKLSGVGNFTSEHGRQWELTKSPVTTNIDTMQQNLVTFMRNGNPEDANTNKNGKSHEEKVTQEIENNASNTLKLVDSVNPKADEDLLELMVRIAENSMEWIKVHRELQQLDQDLVSSPKFFKELNATENFKHSMEKKDKQNIINGFDSQTNVTKEYRKHIQGDKKKKKKKKQKQKGKLKNQAVKLKVKSKEEMRREELEKAGVLDGNGTSKVSKENLKSKTHWNKTSKQSSHSHIFIDYARNNSTNRKEQPISDLISKETQNMYLPGRFTQEGESHRMPSIDSTLAKLTDYRFPVKLPTSSDTIKLSYNKHKTKNYNDLKINDMQNKIDSSWPSDIENQKNDKYKWYGTRLTKDMQESQGYLSDKFKFKILEKNGLIGTPRYSPPLEGSAATYTWQNSGSNFNPWLVPNRKNPKEERRYYNEKSIYNSPNTGWPRFSAKPLKHRSDKTGVDISLDRSIGSNKENYYSLDKSSDSLETGISKTTKQNIISGNVKIWSKPIVATSKHTELLTNTWPQSEQKHISAIDTAIAQHTKEASSSRQWPHFTYHRVTSSPQMLVQQQKEAQQRNRQRNAYIAVSVITPPGRNKSQDKHQSTSNSNKSNESTIKSSVTPLPDKMDQLLSMRSAIHKLPVRDLLEEQLVDMAIAGEQKTRAIPWSHARHLDKIQEQLKTLSAMGEKLQYHWLEKERLLQILRDGGMSGSGFYRTQKNEDIKQERVTTSSHVITPQTFP